MGPSTDQDTTPIEELVEALADQDVAPIEQSTKPTADQGGTLVSSQPVVSAANQPSDPPTT